jgi:adenylate cyclase class IV
MRIHLDRVDGLGAFIEFEAVFSDDGDTGRLTPLLADLRQSFGIEEADLLRGSYSDLLAAAARTWGGTAAGSRLTRAGATSRPD